jgi:hypothetical protein
MLFERLTLDAKLTILRLYYATFFYNFEAIAFQRGMKEIILTKFYLTRKILAWFFV